VWVISASTSSSSLSAAAARRGFASSPATGQRGSGNRDGQGQRNQLERCRFFPYRDIILPRFLSCCYHLDTWKPFYQDKQWLISMDVPRGCPGSCWALSRQIIILIKDGEGVHYFYADNTTQFLQRRIQWSTKEFWKQQQNTIFNHGIENCQNRTGHPMQVKSTATWESWTNCLKSSNKVITQLTKTKCFRVLLEACPLLK